MADLHRTAGECNHERCSTLTAVRPLAKVYVLYHAAGSTSVPSNGLYAPHTQPEAFTFRLPTHRATPNKCILPAGCRYSYPYYTIRGTATPSS
jgi:hypothetical protein